MRFTLPVLACTAVNTALIQVLNEDLSSLLTVDEEWLPVSVDRDGVMLDPVEIPNERKYMHKSTTSMYLHMYVCTCI